MSFLICISFSHTDRYTRRPKCVTVHVRSIIIKESPLPFCRYGYNQLKHYGYVEWSGMRNCYFCGLDDEETYVGFGGALASVILLVVLMPVGVFHSKLKKRHRELTEPSYELAPNQYMHSVQLAPHHQYNRYISETKMYHDPNQVATRYQMDPYAAARANIQPNPYAQQQANTQWNY